MRKLGFLCLSTVAILLGGCSVENATSEKTKLTYWTTTAGQETEAVQKLVDQFEKEHKTIDIEMKEVSFSSAPNLYKTAALGGAEPDIFRSEIAWTTELADLNLLLPISKRLSKEDREDYYESAFRYNEFNGEVYGLPMVTDAPALLYNKRLLKEAGFSEPPQTMDELLVISKALTKDGRYGIYVTNDSYFSVPFLWAFGGGMVSDDGEIQISNQGSLEGIRFMLKLKSEGVTQPYPVYEDPYNTMMTDFKEGKAAMIINGPWASSDVLTGKEFQDASNFGIAPIPAGPAGQGSPTGGHNYVISKYTEHADEAYEFITYMNSTKSQIFLAKEIGVLPTRKSAYEDASLTEDEIFMGFKSQIDVAKARPVLAVGGQLFGEFTPELEKILLGEIPPEQGLETVKKSWEILLK